jgi:nuclear factor related to kappa-B-binding protein
VGYYQNGFTYFSEILPEDYVPYMEYKPSMGAYQWIGAGRDSDHRLVTLCSLWLERGADRSCAKVMQEQRIQVEPPSIPPVDPAPPPPRGPAVQPTSHRDRQLFRIQVKILYVLNETLLFFVQNQNDFFIFYLKKI